jgi:hypothetical protein
MLRWVTPVMYFPYCRARRRARRQESSRRQGRDVVRVGEPRRAVFDRPDVFDVTRTPNDHLAFNRLPLLSGGSLAQSRRVLFEAAVASSPSRPRTLTHARNHIAGIKHMPVRLD